MAPRLIQALAHPQGAFELIYAGAEDDDVCLVQDEAGLAVEVDGAWERFGRDLGLNLIDHMGNGRAPWRLAEPADGVRLGLDLGPSGAEELYLLQSDRPVRGEVMMFHRDPFTGGPVPVEPGRRYRLRVQAAILGAAADLVLLTRDREGQVLDTVRRKLPDRVEGATPAVGVDFTTIGQAAHLEIGVAWRSDGEQAHLWLGRPALGSLADGAAHDWSWVCLPRAALADLRARSADQTLSRLRAPLPEHLLDGAEHRLLLRVLGYDGAIETPALAFRHDPRVKLSKAGLERGSVVRLAGRPAGGELFRLDLQFCIDGRLSERHRIKLREGKFDARLPIPRDWLDGRPHLIEVREADTQAVLFAVNRRTAAFHTRWPVLQQHAQAPLSPESSPARQQHLRTFEAWGRRMRVGAAPPALLELHRELLAGPRKRPVYPPLAFTDIEQPRASVIVPAHNKFEVTHLCLAALLFAPVEASFEVVLVDDGSTDETARIEQIVSGLNVVRHDQPQGFVAACNHGAESARGEYLVFLNNDTEVTAGWLDELLAPFERSEAVGLAGAKLIYPDGRLQEAGGIVWGSGDPWNVGRGAEPDEPAWRYARDVDYVSGAAIMTPGALWRELGGFGEAFAPAYFEDTDYAMKVRASGRRVVYAPAAEVVHYEGLTSGTDKAEGAKRFQEINRPKFKQKWRELYAGRRALGDRPDLEKDRDATFRVLVVTARLPSEDADAARLARAVRDLDGKPTMLPLDLRRRPEAEALEGRGVECLSAPHVRDLSAFLRKSGPDFDVVLLTEPAAEATLRALLGPQLATKLVLAARVEHSDGATRAWLTEALARASAKPSAVA